MPTVLRSGRYRFFFYSNEGTEPPHVHAEAGGKEAKYWLSPVALAKNHGCTAHELHEIEAIIQANLTTLQGAWDAYFNNP